MRFLQPNLSCGFFNPRNGSLVKTAFNCSNSTTPRVFNRLEGFASVFKPNPSSGLFNPRSGSLVKTAYNCSNSTAPRVCNPNPSSGFFNPRSGSLFEQSLLTQPLQGFSTTWRVSHVVTPKTRSQKRRLIPLQFKLKANTLKTFIRNAFFLLTLPNFILNILQNAKFTRT